MEIADSHRPRRRRDVRRLLPRVVPEILGFKDTKITYHKQKYNYKARPVNLFTVVGKREGKDNGGLLPPSLNAVVHATGSRGCRRNRSGQVIEPLLP